MHFWFTGYIRTSYVKWKKQSAFLPSVIDLKKKEVDVDNSIKSIDLQ